MTQTEIIKGLECCQTKYDKRCEECPYKILKTHHISVKSCSSFMLEDVLELVRALTAPEDEWDIK